MAIDTHFVARGCTIRLARIIAANPGCIGLGLEEDTGVVTVVDGMGCSSTNIHLIEPGQPITVRDLRVHILSAGERYTLPVQQDLHW